MSGFCGKGLTLYQTTKVLDWSKFKEFADDISNLSEKLKFVFGRVVNIVGKGENAGFRHFSLFPTMFSISSYLSIFKSQDCVMKS